MSIPRGPEDIPLKQIIADLPLILVVIDIKTKQKIREEKINFSNREIRVWIGRITVWAAMNGYMVQTCAEKDYVVG